VSGPISANDSTSPKTVTAVCPGGRFALGGGYNLSGTSVEDLVATENRAISDTTWQVTARESDNVGGSWQVQAFVICANATASP
jgi:hypothetical protein